MIIVVLMDECMVPIVMIAAHVKQHMLDGI